MIISIHPRTPFYAFCTSCITPNYTPNCPLLHPQTILESGQIWGIADTGLTPNTPIYCCIALCPTPVHGHLPTPGLPPGGSYFGRVILASHLHICNPQNASSAISNITILDDVNCINSACRTCPGWGRAVERDTCTGHLWPV